ncbi:hypothetical protein BH20ACT6_BH20ACT6_25390 [soil metagenome]
MPKSSKDRDRAARIEQMRRETARAERRRTLVVVAICGVVALAIVGATSWKLITDRQRAQEVAGTPLAELGMPASQAGCTGVRTEPAQGGGQHQDGQDIDYPSSPPAYGPHWGNAADFARKFYTANDRPEVEQLVHNLEHGYTLLWYDETVADSGQDLQAVRKMAEKFELDSVPDDVEAYDAAKFIAVPWTSDDGEAFPDGAHVALTRWAAEGEDAAEGEGLGATLYCERPSGEAVADFMAEYPASNALEPGAA